MARIHSRTRPCLRMLNALPWLVVSCLATLACHQLFGTPYRYIDRAPAEAELVGTWKLTARSLETLEFHGFAHTSPEDHHLQLYADGRCTFRSYWSYGDPALAYVAGSRCSWWVSRAKAYVGHDPVEVPVVEIQLSRGSGILAQEWLATYYITKEHAHLILWDSVGDPDYEEYADWVRQPDPQRDLGKDPTPNGN